MAAPILVFGHKEPDNDAISAAVGYAATLKNRLAKRAGSDAVYRSVPSRRAAGDRGGSWARTASRRHASDRVPFRGPAGHRHYNEACSPPTDAAPPRSPRSSTITAWAAWSPRGPLLQRPTRGLHRRHRGARVRIEGVELPAWHCRAAARHDTVIAVAHYHRLRPRYAPYGRCRGRRSDRSTAYPSSAAPTRRAARRQAGQRRRQRSSSCQRQQGPTSASTKRSTCECCSAAGQIREPSRAWSRTRATSSCCSSPQHPGRGSQFICRATPTSSTAPSTSTAPAESVPGCRRAFPQEMV